MHWSLWCCFYLEFCWHCCWFRFGYASICIDDFETKFSLVLPLDSAPVQEFHDPVMTHNVVAWNVSPAPAPAFGKTAPVACVCCEAFHFSVAHCVTTTQFVDSMNLFWWNKFVIKRISDRFNHSNVLEKFYVKSLERPRNEEKHNIAQIPNHIECSTLIRMQEGNRRGKKIVHEIKPQ